jgi:hypothetical protein
MKHVSKSKVVAANSNRDEADLWTENPLSKLCADSTATTFSLLLAVHILDASPTASPEPHSYVMGELDLQGVCILRAVTPITALIRVLGSVNIRLDTLASRVRVTKRYVNVAFCWQHDWWDTSTRLYAISTDILDPAPK